jgi:hypothetical protein
VGLSADKPVDDRRQFGFVAIETGDHGVKPWRRDLAFRGQAFGLPDRPTRRKTLIVFDRYLREV